MPRTTILRDLSLLTLTALLFWQDALSRHAVAEGASPSLSASILGVAAGVSAALAGFLLHEWGHLAGALAAGSFVHYPNRLLAPLLFHFDTARNDRRQFLWMSWGGYGASALGLLLIAWLVPREALSGRVALGLAGLGLAVTLVAEVPITTRVLRGAPLPTGYAYGPPR
jgi:hypothetical protein